jgi:putative transcriptional regulator
MVLKFITTEKGSEMAQSIVQNNIRTLRFHAGEMTQQELADQARVSRQTIVAIEKGNYSPSLELAFRLAHIFKTPLDEVFTYDPNDDNP